MLHRAARRSARAAVVVCLLAAACGGGSAPAGTVVLDGDTRAGTSWRLLVDEDPRTDEVCLTLDTDTTTSRRCGRGTGRLGLSAGSTTGYPAGSWWVTGNVPADVPAVAVSTGGGTVTTVGTAPGPEGVRADRRFFAYVADGFPPREVTVAGLGAEGDVVVEEEPAPLPGREGG